MGQVGSLKSRSSMALSLEPLPGVRAVCVLKSMLLLRGTWDMGARLAWSTRWMACSSYVPPFGFLISITSDPCWIRRDHAILCPGYMRNNLGHPSERLAKREIRNYVKRFPGHTDQVESV